MHKAILAGIFLLTALAIYCIMEIPTPHPAADAVAVTPSAQNQSPSASSKIYSLTLGKLVSKTGADYHFPADAPADGVQYYAIYYSAQWCPPCHAFTPVLVDWYNRFKPAHPNFELIFVSDDHDEASMLDYMKEMSMPWPALDYEYVKHDGSGIEKYAGDGIPDLVLIDSDGNLLADSYQGGTYVGPQSAVTDIERIVGGGQRP
jgi:nucleoredoxin